MNYREVYFSREIDEESLDKSVEFIIIAILCKQVAVVAAATSSIITSSAITVNIITASTSTNNHWQ